MKLQQLLLTGKWVDIDGAVRFSFDNGWTASLMPMGHGLTSCIVFPTKGGKGSVGPQEAFDDEVADWLVQVAAWEPPT